MATATAPISRKLHPLPDVAEALGGVCEKTVRNLIARKKLKAVKVGRRTMVRDDDLQDYIARLPSPDSDLFVDDDDMDRGDDE